MIIKKCMKCGALINVLKSCTCEDCGITCCGEKMVELRANTTDASIEKHVPNYEVNGEFMTITVNHVMENDHYIEWVMATNGSETRVFYFKPGDIINIRLPYEKGIELYSYCNKHNLWKTVVK